MIMGAEIIIETGEKQAQSSSKWDVFFIKWLVEAYLFEI